MVGVSERGALCWAAGGEASVAAVGLVAERGLSSPGAARERLGLGGDTGAQWGDNHRTAQPAAGGGRRGDAAAHRPRGACLRRQSRCQTLCQLLIA